MTKSYAEEDEFFLDVTVNIVLSAENITRIEQEIIEASREYGGGTVSWEFQE